VISGLSYFETLKCTNFIQTKNKFGGLFGGNLQRGNPEELSDCCRSSLAWNQLAVRSNPKPDLKTATSVMGHLRHTFEFQFIIGAA
jgi:hypothetical protein